MEIANIFTEALGKIKIEKEAKRLKAEGKTLADFTEEEIVNRYIDWTVWEVIQLKKIYGNKIKEGKNNG